jgi:hypothetical protein
MEWFLSIRFIALLSTPATPSAAPPDSRKLDPLKHHQQVGGGDLGTVAGLTGKLEATGLQSLVPNPESGAVERENLQPVPTPIPEHKQGSRKRVLEQALANGCLEAVE